MLTWSQKRELDREAWLLAQLDALARLRLDDLTDPAVVRAIATHAAEAAALATRLQQLRGDDAALEAEIAGLAAGLDAV